MALYEITLDQNENVSISAHVCPNPNHAALTQYPFELIDLCRKVACTWPRDKWASVRRNGWNAVAYWEDKARGTERYHSLTFYTSSTNEISVQFHSTPTITATLEALSCIDLHIYNLRDLLAELLAEHRAKKENDHETTS